jgi:hypothetical protein
MPNDENPNSRLNHILREWGFKPDSTQAANTTSLLESLKAWLEGGIENLRVVVRAVQVLLADPEKPGIARRPALSQIFGHKGISQVWSGAGADPIQDVPFLQALLLAVWPRERRDGGFALAPLLDSAWETVRGREIQRITIAEWREQICSQVSSDGLSSAKTRKSLVVDLSASMQPLLTVLDQNKVQGGYQLAGPSILEAVKLLETSIEELSQNAEDSMVSLESDGAERELLWWGQARFCHTLRKPFRRLGDPEQVLWWAAKEVSERVDLADVEPAAAYLGETLHALGQDLNEKRPLRDWMRGLHQVLKGPDAKLVPKIEPSLEKLVEKDALGLPVTWIRWQASAGKEFDAEEADKAIALDLETEIDRWQWATWVLRELLLDLHFAVAEVEKGE